MKVIKRRFRAVSAVFATAAITFAGTATTGSAAASPSMALSVDSAGRIVNNGSPIQLHGVSKSSGEYGCMQNLGVFTGDVTQTGVNAMKTWGINIVRLPLNEDCWLGAKNATSDPHFGSYTKYRGSVYQSRVKAYVDLLTANGMAVELDLHWNSPDPGALAVSQQPMADQAYSPSFWKSVASAFKSYPNVIFELYNEPHGISWQCWSIGGCTATATNGRPYVVAGMNQLISAVRATGAQNLVEANGLQWANDLSKWLANKPVDPAKRLIAGAHVYDINECRTVSCWNATYKPITATVPILISEFGTLSSCTSAFSVAPNVGLLPWADSLGTKVSYLAWSWNASTCTAPSLVTNTSTGSPTPNYGANIRSYYLARGRQ